ncbi:poly [ADP-ribose] polymerase tankyrase-2-like isoform X2 [Lineus longissimus]|uniref:poly [ADP-ribose] polymerase tankyrase-2-like isoform X2 n=1 Tax=Lineus longissimus TaxID=88925 RepID=UPI002B4D3C1E
MLEGEEEDVLYKACLEGPYRVVRDILDNKTHLINVCVSEGQAPIHAAVFRQEPESITDILLKYGADVNLPTQPEKETALHLLAKEPQSQHTLISVRMLVNRGADPFKRNRDLRSAFDENLNRGNHEALEILQGAPSLTPDDELPVKSAVTEEVHTLVQDATAPEIRKQLLVDPWSVHRHNENGLLPIHLVVQRDGDDVNELIDVFISHNADVNGKTVIEEDTALHVLVKNVSGKRALHTARKLLSVGADPKIRNKRLRTAYDYAIQKGDRGIVEVLTCEKWHMDPMALITAVTRGTVDDIRKVIRLGGDVNMKTEIGQAPIHYVITHRHKHDKGAVLDLLIEHNANINSQNMDKDTAMHLAIKDLPNDNELYLLVEYLLGEGCDATIPNKMRKEAVDIAMEKGYRDIVHLLEGRGIGDVKADLFNNVNAGDFKGTRDILDQDRSAAVMFNENGLNPLHVVAMQEPNPSQLNMIDTLIEGGANVDCQTLKNNDTPLHLAAKHDNADVIKRLLQYGADVDRRNQKGKTPYEEAADREHVSAMEAFEAHYEAKELERTGRSKEGQPKDDKNNNKKSESCTIL